MIVSFSGRYAARQKKLDVSKAFRDALSFQNSNGHRKRTSNGHRKRTSKKEEIVVKDKWKYVEGASSLGRKSKAPRPQKPALSHLAFTIDFSRVEVHISLLGFGSEHRENSEVRPVWITRKSALFWAPNFDCRARWLALGKKGRSQNLSAAPNPWTLYQNGSLPQLSQD